MERILPAPSEPYSIRAGHKEREEDVKEVEGARFLHGLEMEMKSRLLNGFRYNLPEKGVAVSPFRYYYWMLFVMTNNFCCGTPIRNGLPVEKKTKVYFRYI